MKPFRSFGSKRNIQGIDNRIYTAFCATSSKMTLDQQRLILIQETYRRNKYWKNGRIDSKDQQLPITLTILVYRYLFQYLLLFLYQHILRNNMENQDISKPEDNKRGLSPTSCEPTSVHMPSESENFVTNPEAIRLAPYSWKRG